MTESALLLAELTPNPFTVFAAGAPLLGSNNIQPTRSGSVFRVTIAITALAANLAMAPNSGSGFRLNGGNDIPVDSVYTEDVAVDQGRIWNFTTETPTGVAITLFRVQELNMVA